MTREFYNCRVVAQYVTDHALNTALSNLDFGFV